MCHNSLSALVYVHSCQLVYVATSLDQFLSKFEEDTTQHNTTQTHTDELTCSLENFSGDALLQLGNLWLHILISHFEGS